MTIRAILWRGFVKKDQLVLNLVLQGVAHWAAHICVRPGQRELSAFIVVKRGRSPPLIHVAIPALRDPVLGSELAAVRIVMASFAIRRRSFELNFVGTSEHLVTFVTRDRAMSSDQRKFRFRMVEVADVDPGAGAVAGFAALRGSIGPLRRHLHLEFPRMGIHMAGRAGAVLEMER